MKSPKVDVLFYVEDPGAANYLAFLPRTLGLEGIGSRLVAGGLAGDCLTKRAVPFTPFAENEKYLEIFKPNLLIVGTTENLDSPGLDLILEAREKNLETIGVVDAYANAGFRFRGRTDDPLAFSPDWLIVPDAWTKKCFEECGYPAEMITICGHPQYDFVFGLREDYENTGKDRFREKYFPEVSSSRSIALFVAEQFGGLNPAQFEVSKDYTLHGSGNYTTRNEIVLEEFLKAIESYRETLFLVLRLPPKAAEEDFGPFLRNFDKVSRKEPALEIVFGSDHIFGMTSTLMIEAALLGKPTFSILPRPNERDWLPTIRAGLTESAVSSDELALSLPAFLKKESSVSKEAVLSFSPFGATDRISSFVAARLGRGRGSING